MVLGLQMNSPEVVTVLRSLILTPCKVDDQDPAFQLALCGEVWLLPRDICVWLLLKYGPI